MEEELWDTLVESEAGRLIRHDRGIVIDSRRLLALHPALARRLVRRCLAQVAGTSRGFEFEHVAAVLELAARERGEGRLRLPGLYVQRSFEWVRFAQGEAWSPESTHVTGPGAWPLAGVGQLVLSAMPPVEAVLRGWEPGDRIVPAGRDAAIQVRDLFQKQRVPRWARRGWPVLEQGGELVWALGAGVSQKGLREGWLIEWNHSHGDG